MNKNKPSRTACKVALNIITLGTIPGMAQILPQGMVQATEALLIKSGTIGKNMAAFSRSTWAVKMYQVFDWMLPGQFEAFAFRKAFCEKQVRDGIQNGAEQVLVLGAGYDTLCWRLAPRFPETRFFEIDHPDTGQFKAKGIQEMGRPENLTLIAEDLGKSSLSTVLRKIDGWNPDAQTVFVAEGLLMYLSPFAVRELFDQCAAVSGRDSRIAFTYIPMGKNGQPDAGRFTALMLWMQKTLGEPWLWSIFPEKLPLFLKQSQWRQHLEYQEAMNKYGVEYYAVGIKE